MDFLSYVSEVSRGWDEPNSREMGRMKAPVNPKGGMYMLSEDMDMKAKWQQWQGDECPTIPAVREMLGDQANATSIPTTSPNLSTSTNLFSGASHCEPKLTNLNTVNEKGKFPSQPSQNPKGVHEVETQDGESSKLRKVKAVITLRSGKEVDQPLPKVRQDEELMSRRTLVKESNNHEEKSGKKNASKSSIEEEPRIVIKEDMMKKHMPPPFSQALHGKKESRIHQKFLKF
ncbi:hypothetical protein CK203_034358 [Vitis vinifera]|uniref:Uncharacterized protein n=1 Tax=Vitis vinifera TaxID=29760 RepID=A0A438INT1_VITVI|nr:hypothetical protein CK203_034358 [Vitis vinifera]